MVFSRELASGYALGVVTGLEDGIAEGDSLKNKDFSIISHRANISSSCFACIASNDAATADVTMLAIDCSTERSMKL